MSGAGRRVTVVEVGPRDGLQNETVEVASDAKVAFIEALAAAGLPVVEATAFVSPKAIPQLADGDEVFRRIRKLPGVRYPVLVPNEKGMDRAEAAGVREIAVFTAASETFNRKNINASIDESFARFAPVVARATRGGMRVRGYVSCGFGCPYEGPVTPAAVARVAVRLLEAGCREISLGDTIGVGHPAQVRALVRAIAGEVSLDRVALHLHDTYGRAVANVWAGYEAGVRTFDASLGGLGGCPYAPGASGNVATEDVVDLFERAGVRTGVDLVALVRATAWLEDEVLKRRLPGRVFRARKGQA